MTEDKEPSKVFDLRAQTKDPRAPFGTVLDQPKPASHYALD